MKIYNNLKLNAENIDLSVELWCLDNNSKISTVKIIDKKEEIEELINEVFLNINLVKCLKP